MLDSKFFFTLIGLIVTVFAICNTNMSPAINEGFWGLPQRKIRVVKEVHPIDANGNPTCGGYSLQNNYQAMLGNKKFLSYPNFQTSPPPRFSNVQYGSNIRYNMPSYANQASPCEPFGDMAKESYRGGNARENFCASGTCGGGCNGGCGVAKCGKGGVSLGGSSSAPSASISHDPNFTTAMNQIRDSEYNTDIISDGLSAVGDMTTINSSGEVENPIIYDRLMYANQSSRLYAQGDPIRGDLAIAPHGGNWFSVHPNPAIDLQTGALNVMGGFDNSNSKAIAELVSASSAGYQTTIGGIDINMANSFETSLHNGGGDIQVTSFA
jgi:hypothetical protein